MGSEIGVQVADSTAPESPLYVKPVSTRHCLSPGLLFNGRLSFSLLPYLTKKANDAQRGEVMCPRSHCQLVIEMEAEPQTSGKPAEDKGPMCIGNQKVSLERNAELEKGGVERP